MTLEEAKKILKREGYDVEKVVSPIIPSIVFTAYSSPEICEAMHVVCSAGYGISMLSILFDDNPALKEAASQFNDSLLDEQGKKIKRLVKELSRLNKIIHKKDLKIEELKNESSERLSVEVKFFVETLDLSQELCDKNEELLLTKISEKNLAELGLKYVVENEKLKKELASKIVSEIDARALKSAESALAYKEKVISEKDDVISDLCKELSATKKELEEKTNLVEEVRKGSKEYRDNVIILSKEEAEIIERCTKNGTELHYSEKDGLTYTNVFGEEMPIRCLRGIFYGFTDDEIENMKK